MPEDVAMTRFIETITPIVNDHASSSESTPPPAPPRPLYRRPQWLALMAIAAVVVVVVGGRYLLHAWAHESTDDAFVDAHVVAIAPKVASYVGAVHVDDNQHVNKGDLLVELDKEQKAYASNKKKDDPAHYFRMMKELTLWGYFTSEAGATKALRYVAVPGRYEGCIDYKKGEKAWATS